MTVDPSAVVADFLAHPDEVAAVLKALEGVDFRGAAEAFRAGNVDGMLQSTENFLGFLALFVPQAQIGVYACMFLLFANKTREAGLWHPSDADDPAALARDARDHRSGGR